MRVVHVTAAPEFARLILAPELRPNRPLGDHVVVASPGPDLEALEQEGLSVVPVPIARKIAPIRDVVSIVRLVRLFRRLRPDLVHTYTPKAGLLGQIAARLSGVPVSVHGCRGLLFQRGMGAGRRWLFRRTEGLTGLLADRVLFVSGADRDYVVAEGLCPEYKARVTGNGVELARFLRQSGAEGRRRATRARLGFSEAETVVLTVGRFVPEKGYLDIVEALPFLRSGTPVRLLWVAPAMSGEGGVLPPELVEDERVAGRVVRLGRQDEMASLYEAADVLLHPSHREGVPRVLIEAAANGLPIVASDIPGNREVVEFGGEAVGFAVGDPRALAAALDDVLGDPAAARVRAEAARLRVVRDNDVGAVATRVADAYRELRPGPLPPIPGWKRPLDLALVALLALPFLLLGFAAGLVVLVGLGRPVLFVQERPGRGGRPFRLVKFRTMGPPRGSDGRPLSDGERLGRIGRWLRASSLDELPEIWNVLRGEMSFVGPRPLLMEYVGLYDPEQARRMDALPGVTGWAQVRGRNAVTWADRFRLDLWYVRNASLALDLRIILMTVGQVLRRRGVSQPGQATMERFRGNP